MQDHSELQRHNKGENTWQRKNRVSSSRKNLVLLRRKRRAASSPVVSRQRHPDKAVRQIKVRSQTRERVVRTLRKAHLVKVRLGKDQRDKDQLVNKQ